MAVDNQGLLVAVDGGQSSTLAIVATPTGQVIGYGQAGPSNHIHEPGGLDRLQAALTDSIMGALQAAGKTPESVAHVCAGLSGVSAAAREITTALAPRAQVAVYNDFVTALAGASRARPGVILIGGTGAVAYGRLDDGREARSDGWGYIMGDEGSAYAIGQAALQAAARATDGRGPATLLLERIPAHFNLADLRAVHRAVYSFELTRPQLAGLAAVVAAVAHEGDAVAQDLLRAAGQRLATTVLAVIGQLGMLETGMAVYTTGGIFRAGTLILAPFREALHRASPASATHDAEFSPIIGALFLALQASGTPLDDHIIQTIAASRPGAAISKHNEATY